MDGLDYLIIGMLAFVAILLPVGIIHSGQLYEEWEATIDVMDCDGLKEYFVEEDLSEQKELEIMKRLIVNKCL